MGYTEEHPRPVFHVVDEAAVIESAGGCIEPINDIP